ncbi:MAG: beta-glucosidase [Clostridiales bacterium]|nr:beta-glucosidase [Clostridiales bacterium]
MNIFKYKISRVWFIVSCSLIAFFLTLTILAETLLHPLFISFLGKRDVKSFGGGIYYTSEYEDKEDAFEKSNELNVEINKEGITLLKNENNALPLAKNSKISVFGKNSVNLAYGGSGSGAFTIDENTPTLYDSLEEAGFTYNPTLKNFYEKNELSGNGRGTNPTMDNSRSTIPGFGTGETALDRYTDDVKNSYSSYNDVALVVFTRIGGESFDLPRTMEGVEGEVSEDDHYLELDKNEQDLLVHVCDNFEKVIVIINCSTSMELGFLDAIADNDETIVPGMENIDSKIDGAVWIGGPGYSGILALGSILNGETTPSGRTIDTYQRDFTKDPTYQNFADNLVNHGNTYLVSDGSIPAVTEHFLDYEESIYVGYRYYETRGLDNEQWYQNNVVYPFGYGLSYTEFEWTVTDWSFDEDEALSWNNANDKSFTITVDVKNVGDYAGKDVVQVYLTAPYTAGEIEKAHVVLVGFAKTELIQPNETKSVEVTFEGYDFASYDYSDANANGFKGYELDEGMYDVKVMRNAHELVANRGFELTENVQYKNDTTTNTEVVNRFDNVSYNEEGYGYETQLSRSDWEGTFPVNEVLAGSDVERTISPEFLAEIKSTATNNPIANDTSVEMPNQAEIASPTGTKKLYELVQFDENGEVMRDEVGTIIVNYDDVRWTEFLDTLTINEIMTFTMQGAFQTLGLESIGLLPAFASDGPVGFVYFMAATEATNPVYKTCSYASECVIAATWNIELAYLMGESVGNEANIGNTRGDGRPYSGWYAPAVNIHRTPFSGRNFEYYSEDPFLSGKLAVEVIKGARSKGVYTQLKHFAVNDQETNRSGVCTWLSEQSLREIYLKPFELAVKEGGTMGMMSSFNRIGSLWTGGDYRLLTEVLRNEWGFRGMVITDFNTEPFMDTKQMCYAGGDLNLATTPKAWTPTTAADYVVLRDAAKNIIYTTARSNGMNGCGEGGYYITYFAWWETMIFTIDIVIAALVPVTGFFAIWIANKQRKANQTKA